jgi:predicted MFS family arabinose efflux permease
MQPALESYETSSGRLTLWLALLAVGTFVLGVDAFVLPGLLPSVARDLNVSVASAGQLTTAFAVTYAISSPVIAAATGAADRRAVLVGGMAAFLLAMIAQATGPTFGIVLAGRVLAGMGAVAFQANAYAVAGVLSPVERRASSLAVIAAGSSLAAVAGVPFGVFVGQVFGWRDAMWLIAGLATLASAFPAMLPPVKLSAVSLHVRLRLFASALMLTLLLVTALIVIPQFAVIS